MLYLMWFPLLQWSQVCLVLDCLHERWSVVLAGAAEQVLMAGWLLLVMVTVSPVKLQQLSVILLMPYLVSKSYLMKQRLTLALIPRFPLFGSAAIIPTK